MCQHPGGRSHRVPDRIRPETARPGRKFLPRLRSLSPPREQLRLAWIPSPRARLKVPIGRIGPSREWVREPSWHPFAISPMPPAPRPRLHRPVPSGGDGPQVRAPERSVPACRQGCSAPKQSAPLAGGGPPAREDRFRAVRARPSSPGGRRTMSLRRGAALRPILPRHTGAPRHLPGRLSPGLPSPERPGSPDRSQLAARPAGGRCPAQDSCRLPQATRQVPLPARRTTRAAGRRLPRRRLGTHCEAPAGAADAGSPASPLPRGQTPAGKTGPHDPGRAVRRRSPHPSGGILVV